MISSKVVVYAALVLALECSTAFPRPARSIERNGATCSTGTVVNYDGKPVGLYYGPRIHEACKELEHVAKTANNRTDRIRAIRFILNRSFLSSVSGDRKQEQEVRAAAAARLDEILRFWASQKEHRTHIAVLYVPIESGLFVKTVDEHPPDMSSDLFGNTNFDWYKVELPPGPHTILFGRRHVAVMPFRPEYFGGGEHSNEISVEANNSYMADVRDQSVGPTQVIQLSHDPHFDNSIHRTPVVWSVDVRALGQGRSIP